MQMIGKLLYWAFECGDLSWFVWISFFFIAYLIWEAIISLFYLADKLHSKLLVAIAIITSVLFLPLYILRVLAKLFVQAATFASQQAERGRRDEFVLDWAKSEQDLSEKTVSDLPKTKDNPGCRRTLVAIVAYVSLFVLLQFLDSDISELGKADKIQGLESQITQQQSATVAQKQNASLPAPQKQSTSTSSDAATTVYITESGSKYHKANCQYLSKSKKSIDLSKAKAQGYEPCSKCY